MTPNKHIEYLSEQHEEIMRAVDRLYHACVTSEGRVNTITDYIVRLLNEQAEQAEVDNAPR